MIIRKKLKQLFFFIYLLFSKFSLFFFIVLNKGKKIYVFDLDNTLANTWPSLVGQDYSNESWRYKSLSVYLNMRKVIMKINLDYSILYLSNRSWVQHICSVSWLKSIGLNGSFPNLILVDKPENKIEILKKMSKYMKVIYVDDLSFGHESGIVKFYSEIAKEVQKLPIRYFGYKTIERINNWKF